MGPSPSSAPLQDAVDWALACARLLGEKKASELVVLDLRNLFWVEYFVIATVSGHQQLRACAQGLERMARSAGLAVRAEGTSEGGWMLVDLHRVVVHLFLPEQRRYYDLEFLWGDAPRLALGELEAGR
jgi:ribosome-associated protein